MHTQRNKQSLSGNTPAQTIHLPEDESAVLAALIIRRCRRLGRAEKSLPLLVQRALGDLCAESDPAAWLLWHWLQGTQASGTAFIPSEERRERRCPSGGRPLRLGDRIWRHGRPWRPGNPILLRRDEQRRLRLLALLLEEIAYDYR
ncbi:hypothetical protein [Pseudorhizobium flavum]|uniref:hypothetical protein n=1 Tax=Pseudorhizobium flavum TaxID=1335061 RepID=UPI0024928192|nr:hypothetical protein [Pseudorhizobium flavum]